MIRRPPRATRTDTLFPYTTLFRSSLDRAAEKFGVGEPDPLDLLPIGLGGGVPAAANDRRLQPIAALGIGIPFRSEEHTSELQSLMRISYAVFCLKHNT